MTGTAAGAVWLVDDPDGAPLAIAAWEAGLAEWEVLRLDADPSFTTVATLALRHATTIRRAGPGPHCLVGVGGGATVAFEVARQLLVGDVPVEHLVVLDGGPGFVHGKGSAAARSARARYRWDGRSVGCATTVVWSSDVASSDSSLGWAAHVDATLRVVHLGAPHDAIRRSQGDDAVAAVRMALDRSS